MKKIVALTLAVMMILALAACDGASDNGSEGNRVSDTIPSIPEVSPGDHNDNFATPIGTLPDAAIGQWVVTGICQDPRVPLYSAEDALNVERSFSLVIDYSLYQHTDIRVDNPIYSVLEGLTQLDLYGDGVDFSSIPEWCGDDLNIVKITVKHTEDGYDVDMPVYLINDDTLLVWGYGTYLFSYEKINKGDAVG